MWLIVNIFFFYQQKLSNGIQMENRFISNQIIINMDSSNLFSSREESNKMVSYLTY